MERMRTAGASGMKTPPPPSPMRMKVRSGEQPVILIDGKRASESQLAALDQEKIASIAIYKEKERLNLSRDGKNEFQVISDQSGKPKEAGDSPVISVTTKMGKASAKPK